MVTVDAATLGARIRERRLEQGLTQAQVGAPELTGGYVSLIECGHRQPSQDALRLIAARLGMGVDELLRGTPPGLEAELELRLHQVRRTIDQGELITAKELVESVVETARQHKLNRVEARAEETLGAVSEREGDPPAALAHFRRAEALWDDEAIHLRVDAITGAARCSRFMGDARMAVHTLDSYRRDLLASRPDPHALMKTYTELIQAYFAIGLPENARDAARAALRLDGQIDDPDEIACMHLTLARTLMYEGRYTDALTSVRRAHEIYSGGGWRNKAAKALIAEGIVLSKKSDYGLARDRVTEALELLRESPNRLDEVLALNELGRIYRNLENPTAALSRLTEARSLLSNGEALEQAFNERETGLSLALLGRPEAESHLRQACDLYRSLGAVDDLAATCKALGDFYLSQGDIDRAVVALRQGLDYIELRSS